MTWTPRKGELVHVVARPIDGSAPRTATAEFRRLTPSGQVVVGLELRPGVFGVNVTLPLSDVRPIERAMVPGRAT